MRTLAKDRPVDEYRFTARAIDLGSGKGMFHERLILTLAATKPFSSGTVVLTYEPGQ